MLRLLLDEHISPQVAIGIRRHATRQVVHTLQQWENGSFLGQSDIACLSEASRQKLALVTYDRRTIPRLLKDWAEEGREHGGIIFVDEKTISPSDTGALVKALLELIHQTSRWDWTNRICFLYRSSNKNPPTR